MSRHLAKSFISSFIRKYIVLKMNTIHLQVFSRNNLVTCLEPEAQPHSCLEDCDNCHYWTLGTTQEGIHEKLGGTVPRSQCSESHPGIRTLVLFFISHCTGRTKRHTAWREHSIKSRDRCEQRRLTRGAQETTAAMLYFTR